MVLSSTAARSAKFVGAAGSLTQTGGAPHRPSGAPPAARVRSHSTARRPQRSERACVRQVAVRGHVPQQQHVGWSVEDQFFLDSATDFVREFLTDAVEQAVDELVHDVEFEFVESDLGTAWDPAPKAAEETLSHVEHGETDQDFEKRMRSDILQALLGGSRNGGLDKAFAAVSALRTKKAIKDSALALTPNPESSSTSSRRMRMKVDGDESASTAAEIAEACNEKENVSGRWSLHAAAELIENAPGAATHPLQSLGLQPSSERAVRSLRVNVGDCDSESVASVDMDSEVSPTAYLGGLLRPPAESLDGGEWDDVLSMSSESDAGLQEREAAKEALMTMRTALAVVNRAGESGFQEEVCMHSLSAEFVEGDLADPAEDFVFDSVCCLVDDGLHSAAEDHVAQDQDEDRDEFDTNLLTLKACPRRPFGRLLRPHAEQLKSCVVPRPWARGLLMQPRLFAPPRMQDVDWSVVDRATAQSTMASPVVPKPVEALPRPAEMHQSELKESEEQMLDALLESLATNSRPASARAPTPRGAGTEATGETFESLLASFSDLGDSPKKNSNAPALNLEPELFVVPMATDAAPSPLATGQSLQKSRSKRWVIGGVVRNPTEGDVPASGPSGSPVPQVASFRMDADEEPVASPMARESSLTRGYEALGRTEIHSLDVQDNFGTSLSNAKLSAFVSTHQAAGKRPMSRSRGVATLGPVSSPLRAAAASALALDLGDALSAPPSRFSGLGAGMRAPTTPAGSPQSWKSSSLGTLRVTKAPPTDMTAFDVPRKLPGLPGHSAGSFAWSMARSRRQGSAAGL